MKEYFIRKVINQCGDCKFWKYLYEKAESTAKCLTADKVIEKIEEGEKGPFKSKSKINWFPDWCPLMSTVDEPEIKAYLVRLEAHYDIYKHLIIKTTSEEEMEKIAKEYARLHYGNIGEEIFEFSNYVEVSDVAIERIFEVLDEDELKELREDAVPELLDKYDNMMKGE